MILNPWLIKNGKINDDAQNRDIFPKLWCQNSSATRGKTAIDSNIPTKGITQKIVNPSPFRCGAEPCELPADSTYEGKKYKIR